MNCKERFNKIIQDVFEIETVDETMTRDNTEKWDSLLHLTLVTAIEDEFDIMMDTEDILDLNSYAEGLKIVAKYCSEE